jgi:uncharacterized protein
LKQLKIRALRADPTRLGTVEDVSGGSVRIKLDTTATGLVFVRGEGYRVGQVGSFVRIPAGYLELYGVVTHVGAGAAPPSLADMEPFGSRWIQVELVGQGIRGRRFERGISQYPSIGDMAYVVTESDLRGLYAPGDSRSYISIGRVASSESIPCYLDLNKLVTRHSAVVGSTGAGKSTAVSSILQSLSNPTTFPSARVLLLDIHGEYAKAFGETANVFRVGSDGDSGEQPLFVPYWALTSEELLSITTGPVSGAALGVLLESVLEKKRASKPAKKPHTVDPSRLTADTPLPFSIHQLWYELHTLQYATHIEQAGKGQSIETWALEKDALSGDLLKGSATEVIRPKFRPHKDEKNDPEKIRKSSQENFMRSQTDALEGKLRDPRFQFMFKPGPWAVNDEGETELDLDRLLASWLGADKQITVLDLSGVPPTVLDDLVGVLLRIVYDSLFWGRKTETGGRYRPLLLVMEEAHAYLSSQGKGRASSAARRIAKEGRKYGVGLMLVSQRPSEVDSTILSQCGTLISMRLTNDADRSQVASCASDSMGDLVGMLPTLRTGEALIIGEAVGLPVRALVDLPKAGSRPDSGDPPVVVPLNQDGKPEVRGGWTEDKPSKDYAALVEAWRIQEAKKINN